MSPARRCRWGETIERFEFGWLGAARRFGLGIDDPLDRGKHVLADLLVDSADIEPENRFVGNDVATTAGLKRANGHHGAVGHGDLTRDDRLQSHDGRGPHHHRVDGRLGGRAMAPAAE